VALAPLLISSAPGLVAQTAAFAQSFLARFWRWPTFFPYLMVYASFTLVLFALAGAVWALPGRGVFFEVCSLCRYRELWHLLLQRLVAGCS
jgi:hypothetical protein